MKRRAEFLVEKRDGRREWLRASKLARSILLALEARGAREPWRAVELAGSVIAGLRCKHGTLTCLTTEEIAENVQRVLASTGQVAAARAYGAVRGERRHRRAELRRAWAGASVTPAPRGRLSRIP